MQAGSRVPEQQGPADPEVLEIATTRGSGRTAVIVVNYGSSSLLASNLATSTSSDEIVVVVDNWTDAAEREAVHKLAQQHGWLVDEPVGNVGFGAGMNRGVRRALAEGATSLLLLNPDARLAHDGVLRMAAQVEADESLLLAPQITRSDGGPWMSGVMDLRLDDGTMRSARHRVPGEAVVEWVSGAVMALNARLWRQIGGFDEEYFLYWEDVDLCSRVHAAGGTVGVDASVVAVHDEGGTQMDGGGRAKSETFYFYNIRNRALYAAKWLSTADRRRWLMTARRAAWDTLMTGGRRQLVESIRPWRALTRGLAASLKIGLGSASTGGGAMARVTTMSSSSGGLVRVLESFVEPSRLTNPYITQLRDSLSATVGVEVHCWSWKLALIGGYDVFHAHWPEALIEGRSALNTLVRRVLYAIFLARLWLTRTPIVRTAHNLELPSGLSRVELWLLRATDRLTSERVVLNEFTPVPAGTGSTLIQHGHYRDWFARYPKWEQVPGRLAFVGKVRRYKNVEGLVAAFSDLPRESGPYSLHIAGKPSSADLVEALEKLATVDPRIVLDLRFIDDPDLVREVGEAELVVLPYHEMHNSGSVLAVLSLDRPVLVPENEFNRRLAAEVGRGWVITFEGELVAQHLVNALKQVRDAARSPRPDLRAREWADVGRLHLASFSDALRRVGRAVPAAGAEKSA